ncbi:glycosyltransferase [Clostridium sp. KNHs214]|uniref:glycosyltransferase n=1 Tax=Clostridium sp. KNHs214 TaxID=1540257 RepID=UPI0005557F8F|nr:glycosyltransferase [Clostridium sp. KNHs214]
MGNKRCIIHLPFHIDFEHPSGSQIRPVRIIDAFKNIGYKAEVITGYGDERKKRIREIEKSIDDGIKYDFLYSESSTQPTLLTEKNHFPKYPFLDFGFLKFCKQRNIKIGLFYRDIYWRFPIYDQSVKTPKRQIAKSFYNYDLYKYNQLLDVIYLPTKLMYEYIPFNFKGIVDELPPGINSCEIEKKNIEKNTNEVNTNNLKIFYVGGISSIYNIKLLFEVVNELSNVELTVCCRKEEWEKEKEVYESFINSRIKIIHKFGKDLEPYFRECDICSLLFEPIEYRNFAMPVKLFEYMTYLKPIISTKGTAAGEFVEKNDIGWNVEYDKEKLKDIMNLILNNRSTLLGKIYNIEKTLNYNTWEARALKVKSDLTSL